VISIMSNEPTRLDFLKYVNVVPQFPQNFRSTSPPEET
jgi:hypothetical protein